MKKNVKIVDRLFRCGLGLVFLAWAIAGGPSWAFLGVAPLASGAWGFSPLYFVLRINRDDDKNPS